MFVRDRFLNEFSIAFFMDFGLKVDPKGEGWRILLAHNSSLFHSCSGKGISGGALLHFDTHLAPF